MRGERQATKADGCEGRATAVRGRLVACATAGFLAAALTGLATDDLRAQGSADDSDEASGVRVEAPPRAPGSEEEIGRTPALLQADQASYDEETKVVTARGNVEIAQGERILLADTVRYDLDADVITATGSVSLLQPNGDVVFAEKMELTGDMEQGAMRAFRLLMTDNTRVAAASAVRTDDNRTEMRKGLFTPCEACREDPSRAPLWQLRAHKVVHDRADKTISYRDAYLELFGVPILYTPYFQHADPTKKRQSGFLPPSVGVSSDIGVNYQQPYYWVLSDSADLTLAPIFSTDFGVIGVGEYRRHTGNGQFRIELSGTRQPSNADATGDVKEGDFRGHVDADGLFEIDENWRWGFKANRTTDDTYMRLFDFDDVGERFLESELYAERFEGRDYFSAQSFAWQGLQRNDDSDEFPFALPELRYNYVGEPGVAGGFAFAESSALNLQRIEGRDVRRLSTTLGWELPHVDPLGGRTTLKTVLHLDGYAFQDFQPGSDAVNPAAGGGALESGTAGRAFPQVALQYSYPLVRHSSLGEEVLKPTVQVVAGPNGGNPEDIPNEDSRSFEFEDSNLFALNRFPGRDRVSSGQRVDYGVSYRFTTRDGSGFARAFVGQSFRLNTDDALPESVGAAEDFSDFVGSLQLSPARYIDGAYRFRIDEDDFDISRSEVDVNLGPPALNLNLNYSRLSSNETISEFETREEVRTILQSRFARYWSASVSTRRDLAANSTLTSGFGLTYHDECFLLSLELERRFFDDRDLDPETRFLVQFTLKHLGSFGTGQGRNTLTGR